MDKQSLMFVGKMDALRWAFEGKAIGSLEMELEDIPKLYGKNQLSIDHYVALMNTARTYMRILKEEN